MTIGTAVMQNGIVTIYDLEGKPISKVGGEALHGYTSETVSVIRNHVIYIYDENGKQLFVVGA